MTSFARFPATLPFFDQLHDQDSLNNLIAELSEEQVVTDISKLDVSERKHPFMDAFDKKANETLTANGGLTNATTQDPIIDLFYGYELVAVETRNQMYEAAWKADPITTLRIIFYGRSIHRGKSLTSAFYNAYCWLLANHPRTALANLHMLIDGKIRTNAQLRHNRNKKAKKVTAEADGWDLLEDQEGAYDLLKRRDFVSHGCWKDLCSFLTIYAQGELEGYQNSEYLALSWPRVEANKKVRREKRRERKQLYDERKYMSPEERAKYYEEADRKAREQSEIKKAEAKETRLKTRVDRNQKVQALLIHDKTYRALHFTIARLFAEQLQVDMQQLKKNKVMLAEGKLSGRHALGFNLSLAAKWAPSLGNSHDKHTFLATSIAELLFPPETHQGKEETREHYLNEVRDLYRKQYLIPLRQAIDLIDHYMQPGQWNRVDISHMPSKCLQKDLGKFFKHAPDTVMNYLDQVVKGKKKLSGATLGPHELVYRLRSFGDDDPTAVALRGNYEMSEKYKLMMTTAVNAQWDTLIESIRETSLLSCDDDKTDSTNPKTKKRVDLGDCLAVCDVSGSMYGGYDSKHPEMAPLYAAIGLTLVITNLAKPPFNGAAITFSAEPEMFKIDTSAKFADQVEHIMQCNAGFNTDLAKVFTDALLPMAKEHKIKPEDMVKRLFIFTDMDFDSCDNGADQLMKTKDFIRKQYQDAGYDVPEIVWWNLCSGKQYVSPQKMNTPIDKDDHGMTLLSGFSSAMVKTFLDGEVDEEEEEEGEEGEEEEQKEGEESKAREMKGPMDFVKKAVNHESFDGLVIID